MGRLTRGLWYVEVLYADGSAETTQPVPYDIAALTAPLLGEGGALRAILRRVPGTHAPWEFRAPWEATDPPTWGMEPGSYLSA
jgi:hypothetical protein